MTEAMIWLEHIDPVTCHHPLDNLAPVDRELLRLLASGATHETAARRLDVSVRTTRRRIAALMKLLDASSPFQAGVEAAKRGWLTQLCRSRLIATGAEGSGD